MSTPPSLLSAPVLFSSLHVLGPTHAKLMIQLCCCLLLLTAAAPGINVWSRCALWQRGHTPIRDVAQLEMMMPLPTL